MGWSRWTAQSKLGGVGGSAIRCEFFHLSSLQALISFWRQLARAIVSAGLAYLLVTVPLAQAQTFTVSNGATLYKTTNISGTGTAGGPCSSCHIPNTQAPPNSAGASAGHLLASNNPAQILTAMSAGGAMAGYFNPIATATQRRQLSMYIGQFLPPALQGSSAITALVKSSGNVSGSVDVFPRLKTDGSSGVAQDGGVSVVSAPNALSTSVSVVDGASAPQYNITYNPGTTLGADTLTFKIVNPAAASGVNGTISVTVVGISSGNLTTTTATAVNYPITVVGAVPTSYSILSGSLPPGLSLASGSITGTPNANASGNYNFRVQAVTPSGNVDKDIAFTVVGVLVNGANSGAVPAVIAGTQGAALATQTFSTNGTLSGANPFSVSAGTLPAGLSLNTANGQITGTPTNGGNTNVTMSVATTAGTVALPVQFQIAFAGTPVVTGPTTASGTVGTAINAPGVQLVATNPAITAYSATGLPPGLNLNTSNGQITGTPTQSQSSGNSNVFSVTVNATNGAGTGGDSTLAFTINPSVVPTVSNATLTPSQNVAFTYDVRANNVTNMPVAAPITNFSATGLPTGLSINAAGVISGTATTSGGPTTAQIAAINSVGTSATATFTINVTPTLMPGITSPTAISGTIGQAITPVQIVASNPPITVYGGAGLPSGITVNSTTGVISGTPTLNGTFNATLTATNNAGLGSLAVTFTIAALPVIAGPGTMTVPLNTATTLDLATFITGTGLTGVKIASNPAHGQVSTNGTMVTYTPVNNYFGTDSFSYAAFGSTGTSAPGVIAVTVVGRPDPSADAAVVGTINNQVETARRFSRSQLSNFQRRLESLHRGGGGTGGSTASAQARTVSAPAPVADTSAPARSLPDLANPRPLEAARNNMQTAPPVKVASLTTVAGAADSAAGASGLLPPGVITSLMSAASNRSLNLASVAGGGGDASGAAEGSASFWFGGDAHFGTRDSTGTMSGTTFKTDGISAGVDRRFSDRLVLGVGVGLARDQADIGSDGTKSKATGASAALYGSYQPSPNTFIDALLGYGTISLDAERYVAPINALAQSHRSGDQVFGSLAAGYEHRDKGLLLSPYGRLDFTVDKLNQTSESGAGQFSLTYFDQTSRTLRSALGVRAGSSHATDWGLMTPRVRVEYQHGFEGGTSAQLAYSDLINGPRYAVTSSATNRNSIVLGLGTDILLRNGVMLGFDYQILRSFSQETSQSLRFTLSKALDGKSPSGALWPNFDAPRPPLGVRVDAGYTYDRNVTRGRDAAEKLSDQSYSIDLSKGWIFPVTEHARAVFALSGGAEKFHSYEGLSRLFSGALGEIQYRTSGDFGAPTFALFTRLKGEQFQSDLRDGYHYSVGASARKPVTDRISVFGAVAHNERSARSSVFTGRDNSIRFNVDYATTPTNTLYLTTEYRRGDAVSSGLSSLASLDIAKVLARDDAFNDALIAYRVEARTTLLTIGYNLPFGPRDSLDFSWRRVQSTSVEAATFYGKSRYVTDQISFDYLLRF